MNFAIDLIAVMRYTILRNMIYMEIQTVMLSQKAIAQKLKISQSTVSRALNNDNSLPLATKLKVKKLAMDNGYEPRRYNTKKQRQEEDPVGNRMLALVHHAPTVDGKYYSLLLEMIQGFIQAAANNGVKLIVKEVDNMESARNIVAEFSNNVIGATLLLRYPAEMINLFCDNFNCVSLNHRYEDVKIRVIEPQQEVAFAQMYRCLYEKGHRRIGFLTVQNSYQFAFSRYAGSMQAAYMLKNSFSSEWAINVHTEDQLSLPQIANQVARLYKDEQVGAYLCSSGSLAKNLIEELKKKKLRVPEDISLAAFDDILTPTADGHLLCGAQANYERMAQMAIKVLRNSQAFTEAAVICCDTDFHYGNTVSELT